MFSMPERMCDGSLLRQRRQRALPTVFSKSQRGQLRFCANTVTCSFVRCIAGYFDTRSSEGRWGDGLGVRCEELGVRVLCREYLPIAMYPLTPTPPPSPPTTMRAHGTARHIPL